MLCRIVPSQIDACKFGSRPILAHFIVFVEDPEEVIGMLFPHIFDSKIVNYEDELYRSPGMFPQACRSRGFEVAGLVEPSAEEIVGELA